MSRNRRSWCETADCSIATALTSFLFGPLVVVLGLVIVNALKASPWGTVTLALTIPIAMFLGVYLRWLRPDRILEATAIGILLLIGALLAGRWVAENPALAPMFTLGPTTLAWWLMGYGLAASILPVWLLLAPRDYLSAFVKIGVSPLILGIDEQSMICFLLRGLGILPKAIARASLAALK